MKIYQVDAFAVALFQGNPAAVVPLTEWLPDEVMQQIAMENNLAETAFIVPRVGGPAPADKGREDGYDFTIRWFTPTVEVELCGHATLASGQVVFGHLGFKGDVVVFRSLHSGNLKVSRTDGDVETLVLDFPVNMPELAGTGSGAAASVRPADHAAVFGGLRIPPRELYRGRHDFMVVLDSQEQVEALSPDFSKLAGAQSRGVVVTSPGREVDFVSRCFYPQSGIDEDPVTGSAHTMMIPYWAGRLGKKRLSAIQLSRRRGHLDCTLAGDRVLIGGQAHTYLVGDILLD
ncbi:MAG TPA: PhzF family phenazine biosynthesis protein [Puia sp.]